jgi:hypothetical protein
LEVTRLKGEREEITDVTALALTGSVLHQHDGIDGELEEGLSARAARWGRGGGIRHDGDATKAAGAGGEGVIEGDSLGAEAEVVARVLNVGPGPDPTLLIFKGGTDSEAAVVAEGAFSGAPSVGQKLVVGDLGHTDT